MSFRRRYDTWVLHQVLLVVGLCVPPVFEGDNFSGNRVLDLGLLKNILHFNGLCLLLAVMEEDCAPAPNSIVAFWSLHAQPKNLLH